MIDQLVQLVASKLGIGGDVAEKAVGVVMGYFQRNGDAGAVNEIFSKIPGAADMAGKYEHLITSGDGAAAAGLGGLMGKLSGMLGGKGGSAMEAMAAFKETGLSLDQAQEMMPVAKDFLEQHVGTDTVARALDSVPALKGLLKL